MMSDTTVIAPDREAFLAERRTGLGGSDIAAVFNLGYGCRRRLWLDKTGAAPDFPDEDSGPMKLGRILEPFIAAEYEQKTGRAVMVEGLLRHPVHEFLIVHIDRTLYDAGRGALSNPGVAEFKAVGRAVFYRMRREGLPVDYILQLQHGMLVSRRSWGAFAVMNRDNGAIEHWDVERDDAICAEILAEAPAFWATVENGPTPDRLDPDDKRCQTCRYRRSCQGAALMECSASGEMERDDSLLPLLNEFRERQTLAKEADELLEETKEQIKTTLGARTAVECGDGKIYYRPQSSLRWDSKALDKAHPELVKDFKKPVESRPLRVY